MTKLFQVIFLILLFQLVKSINKTQCENDEQEVFNAFDCMNRKLEENQNEDHCCFIKYKTKIDKIIKGCAPLSEKEFENIQETLETYENLQDIEIQTLDCFSSFTSISFTLLYILLFL